MKIKVTNKKIIDALTEKNKFVTANQTLLKEMESLEAEFQKNLAKAQRSDEKARPLIKKEIEKLDLKDFEEVSRITFESGEWEIEVINRLEEFKTLYAQRKADANSK
jgi:hypothetical protein